tara:strand:- start:41562 stop:41663 length:102 start_codon:yes stop_codon:yes gene_type:complete
MVVVVFDLIQLGDVPVIMGMVAVVVTMGLRADG